MDINWQFDLNKKKTLSWTTTQAHHNIGVQKVTNNSVNCDTADIVSTVAMANDVYSTKITQKFDLKLIDFFSDCDPKNLWTSEI